MKLTAQEHAFRKLVRNLVAALAEYAELIGIRRKILFYALRDAITAEQLRDRR